MLTYNPFLTLTRSDRLRLIRNYLDLKQEEFAEQISVKYNRYKLWESRGIQSIPAEAMIALEKKFDVNRLWLLEGKGDMFLSEKALKGKVETLEQTLEEKNKLLERQDDLIEQLKEKISRLEGR